MAKNKAKLAARLSARHESVAAARAAHAARIEVRETWAHAPRGLRTWVGDLGRVQATLEEAAEWRFRETGDAAGYGLRAHNRARHLAQTYTGTVYVDGQAVNAHAFRTIATWCHDRGLEVPQLDMPVVGMYIPQEVYPAIPWRASRMIVKT